MREREAVRGRVGVSPASLPLPSQQKVSPSPFSFHAWEQSAVFSARKLPCQLHELEGGENATNTKATKTKGINSQSTNTKSNNPCTTIKKLQNQRAMPNVCNGSALVTTTYGKVRNHPPKGRLFKKQFRAGVQVCYNQR